MKLRNLNAATLLAQPSFPRVTPDEEFILRDFVREYGRVYSRFSVDVPVGGGLSQVNEQSGVSDHMWSAITRRRIDLLAFAGDVVAVVEAKIHATVRTVTQVNKYRRLYDEDQAYRSRVIPVIVCRSASPGVAALLLTHGGRLIELPTIVRAPVVESQTTRKSD